VLYGLLSPWTPSCWRGASARRLQIGPAVEVVAPASVAANLVAIMGGIVVFDEPVGSGPPAIGARLVAFLLVIVGAALMPVQHAEEREHDTAPPLAASLS
jgi:hypothetical protein